MILVALFVLLVALYLYSTTRKHDYWKKRGVKYEQPLPLFGNTFRVMFGHISSQDDSERVYRKYSQEKMVGYFKGSQPELIVKDLNIIRHILNTDFVYFHKRGFARNPKVEPLHMNIFSIDGDTWKLLRQKQTPVFTTAKLKSMFPLIVECAEKLYGVGENIISEGGECNIKELMARFTIEFIGSCGFGINMNTINNENSYFQHIGELLNNPPLRSRIMSALWEFFPDLRPFLRIDSIEVEKAMFQLLESVRNQRHHKPIGRNDFVDLMLELECLGKIKGESIEKFKPDGTPMEVEMEMDIKVLAAQVFIFFAAGFETSSTATSYLLHELAYHTEIQEKIQEEIDRVLSKYDNKLCYSAVAEMTYLEMALKEALRKFPPVAFLNRECAKKYTLPNTNITLDPGTKILIPIQALHKDEKYFDNPHEFRPERFSPENIKIIERYSYLPFGEGPRMCIGTRLGQMQSMAGLAAVLHKFSVEPASTSRYDLQKDPGVSFLQGIIGGIPVKLKHRKFYKIS